MIIMGPSASGDYEPLAISDGFLEFHSLSRKDLYGYYGDDLKEGFFDKVHPEEKEKAK